MSSTTDKWRKLRWRVWNRLVRPQQIVIFTSISCQRRKAGHHVPISTLTLQIRQACAFNPAKLGNNKAIFHLLYTYIEKKMSICFVVKEIILNFALAFNKEAGWLQITPSGEMVEWSITTVLKTVVPRGTGGSNPSLSASHSELSL